MEWFVRFERCFTRKFGFIRVVGSVCFQRQRKPWRGIWSEFRQQRWWGTPALSVAQNILCGQLGLSNRDSRVANYAVVFTGDITGRRIAN